MTNTACECTMPGHCPQTKLLGVALKNGTAEVVSMMVDVSNTLLTGTISAFESVIHQNKQSLATYTLESKDELVMIVTIMR